MKGVGKSERTSRRRNEILARSGIFEVVRDERGAVVGLRPREAAAEVASPQSASSDAATVRRAP